MITLYKQPATVSLTKNPIPLGMESDNAFTQAAAAYVGRLYLQGALNTGNFLDGSIADGETIDFVWAGKNLVVTAKTVPLLNGYEIPAGVGDLTHAQAIKAHLEANKALDTDFTFVAVDDGTDVKLTITGKRTGMSPYMSFNFEQAIFDWTDELAAVIRENFKLWWELYAALPGGVPELLFQRVDDVDSDGKALLELNLALHAFLSADRPSCKETNVTVCSKSKCKYYIQYAEYFGEAPELSQIKWTTDKQAIRGGLSRTLYPGNAYFTTYLSNKFMTWMDNNRSVRTDQPLFLSYFLQLAGISQLKIKIVTNFSDDTAATTRYLALVDVEQYSKLLVPCGFTQLLIGSDRPGHPVDNYEISLVRSTNVAISETRTFYVDRTYRLYPRYFIYESSLSSYETLFIYGKVEKDIDFSPQISEVKLPYNYKLSDGEEEEFEINYSQKFEVNTGFILSKKQFEELTDFLISPDKLWYDQVTKRLIPIKVISKSVKFWKDGDGLYKTKFECAYRFTDNSYSDETINLDPDNGDLGPIDDGGSAE